MKPFIGLIAVTLLGAASFAAAQINIPDPQSPGMSPDSAVRLVATSDVMLDRSIRRWLRQHYPDWNADPYDIREIGFERYAVVSISSPNYPSRKVYFRLARNQAEDNDGFPTGRP
jgi:hypothetical protein